MVLTTHELDLKDLPHLYCTDPRLADEVAAVNRSLERLDEGIPTWTYLDPSVAPDTTLDGKEATPQ